MRDIRVGMIGYKFMGKAHSFAYKTANMFFDVPLRPQMSIICGRNEKPLKIAQERFGWQSCETDWRKVVRNPDIDMIDIATTPNTHMEIAVEAAKEGKIIFCEKPLASTLKDAYKMLEAVEKYNVKHAICFNYRKLPAIGLAKKLLEEDKLGKICHMRAVYLQDWIISPEFPLDWRLQRAVAGSGSHGDLNVHMIDMARYLIGEFEEVAGMNETFIKERPLVEKTGELTTGLVSTGNSSKSGMVDVDDTTLFLARFKNGAVGSFEATRFAAGRKNHQRFEINGTRGSLVFNLERLNELQYYSMDDPDYCQGFKTIMAMDASHPYAENWWPNGHIIGYGETFVNMFADLLIKLGSDEQPTPNFYDGIKSQEVLAAVDESIENRTWCRIKIF